MLALILPAFLLACKCTSTLVTGCLGLLVINLTRRNVDFVAYTAVFEGCMHSKTN